MASRSWNRVELIGNLTRDPELRYTPTGAAVCTFSVATNRTYVTDGEKREEVDFHRLVAWNKLAELCNQLLKKGNKVFISGRLQNRSWEGADGIQKNITEIVVEDMIVLSPKGEYGSVTPPTEDINLDDLPKVAPSVAPIIAPVKPADTEPVESKKEEKAPEKPVALSEDVSPNEDLPF